MKFKSQTDKDSTSVKKKNTNNFSTKKENSLNSGSITVPKSGGISKKKQKNIFKKENKINLNGVAKLEDNTAEELTKLNSVNNKKKNNPVHPLFLKNRKNNEDKVSNVTVPTDNTISTKQNNNKKIMKKLEITQEENEEAVSNKTKKKNKTQGAVEKPNSTESSDKFNMKIQFKKNKKRKGKGIKPQSNADDESAISNSLVSPKPLEDVPKPVENDANPTKKKKRNRNKKLKKSSGVQQQNNIVKETAATNLSESPQPPLSNVITDSPKSAKNETTPNKKRKRNRNKKLKKSIEAIQQNNDSETTPTNSSVSPKPPHSNVNADSPKSPVKDTTPNKKQGKNKNKKLKLDQNQSETTETSNEDNTIFVGNLPIDVEKKDLENLFKSYGKIVTIRLRSAASSDQRIPKKVAVITQNFHKDVSSINAFVVFEEKFEARNALIANGSVFKGHHIRVDYAKSKGQHNNKIGIFVGNLPFNVKDDELWKTFENCGEIESVRVIRDEKTRMGKGFGYVNFKSADGVELALQLEDVTIQNRKLRIARTADPRTGKQGGKGNKPMKRKFSMSSNNSNDDSIVEKKKMKSEISKLSENDGSQNLKKKNFQGEKSAAHKLKKQTFKKKVKKIRNEKHKKSIASLLTSTSNKGLMSKE